MVMLASASAAMSEADAETWTMSQSQYQSADALVAMSEMAEPNIMTTGKRGARVNHELLVNHA